MAFGHLDECWQYLQKARALAEGYNYREWICETHCIAGDVYLFLEDFPRAVEEYKLGAIYDQPAFETLNSLYRLGMATASNGDEAAGQAILEKAIKIARQVNLGAIFLPAELALMRIRLRTTPVEQFLPLLEAYAAEPRLDENAQAALWLRIVRLEIAIRLHQPQEVEAQARALIAWSENLGSPFMGLPAWRLLLGFSDRQDPLYHEAWSKVKASLDEMRLHAQTGQIRPLFARFYQAMLKRYSEILKGLLKNSNSPTTSGESS